jgi:hypothetical protein
MIILISKCPWNNYKCHNHKENIDIVNTSLVVDIQADLIAKLAFYYIKLGKFNYMVKEWCVLLGKSRYSRV